MNNLIGAILIFVCAASLGCLVGEIVHIVVVRQKRKDRVE